MPQLRFIIAILLVSSLLIGCGQPKIAPANLRLTMALRTAISAQNKEWLDRCREQITERQSAGSLTAEEFERFQAILAMADKGEWSQAEQAVVRWQKAQRPTAP